MPNFSKPVIKAPGVKITGTEGELSCLTLSRPVIKVPGVKNHGHPEGSGERFKDL